MGRLAGQDGQKTPADPLSPVNATVEEAVRLGADAVGYTLYVGSPAQERDFAQYLRVREDAERFGMPLICGPTPAARRSTPRAARIPSTRSTTPRDRESTGRPEEEGGQPYRGFLAGRHRGRGQVGQPVTAAGFRRRAGGR